MARIIDIVRTRRNVIEGNIGEADNTGQLAVAALSAGIGTPQWQAYMNHFPGLSPIQLQRLNGTDGTLEDPTLKKKRAYLVGNGTCGTQSPQTVTLAARVNSIDAGLDVCDPEP